MASKATNQKKGIVTRGSGHVAESSGVSLPYFKSLQIGLVMDDNHIETSKCGVPQAARRTLVEGHHVIHSKSKIGIPHGGGPSRYDRPHSYARNNPQAYQWFAEPDEKSPDTKVEGSWVVRTFDKTKQDGYNGPGKFSPAPGRAEILDESELLFQQCSVGAIKLECDHGRSTTGGELHVFIGDAVTVTAYRVNASETDPEKRLDIKCHFDRYKQKRKPPAAETKHAAFLVTRNGRFVMPTLKWDEITGRTLVGRDDQVPVAGSKKVAHVSVLRLGESWLLKPPSESNQAAGGAGGSYESYDRRQDGATIARDHFSDAQRDVAQRYVDRKQEAAERARQAPGRPGRRSGAPGQANRNVEHAQARLDGFNQAEAERAQNQKTAKAISGNVRLLLDSWKIVMEYFAFQPLRIGIEAHGCSPGAKAVVLAYPEEEFGAELAVLKDFPGKQVVDTIKGIVTNISDFWKKIKGAVVQEIGDDPKLYKPGGFNIDLYFFRSSKSTATGKVTRGIDLSPSVELTLAWRELVRDSNPGNGEIQGRRAWQVHRMWEVDVKLERLLGLDIQFEVDLNYCLGLGKVITDVLGFFGVQTGIFLDLNLSLSVGVGGTVGRDEYGKWTLSILNVPLKAVIQVSLVVRVGRFLEVGFRVTGRWEPKFKLGKNDKGQLCIKCTQATFDIILTFEAQADILGWSLDYSYQIQKWPFNIPGGDLVLFGDGT